MTYQEKREIGIPSDATKTEFSDIKYTIYTYKIADYFVVKVYGGRRTKADSFYRFNTKDARTNYINEVISEKYRIDAARKEAKIEKKKTQDKAFKNVKVGDLFYTSWGYDQTNVEFYQLVALKGKTGTFREISKVQSNQGYMSADVTAVKDSFIGDVFTSRITGDVATQMRYGQRAYKTSEGKAHYSSWYA